MKSAFTLLPKYIHFQNKTLRLDNPEQSFCHAESIFTIIFCRFLLCRNDRPVYKTPADLADFADDSVKFDK